MVSVAGRTKSWNGLGWEGAGLEAVLPEDELLWVGKIYLGVNLGDLGTTLRAPPNPAGAEVWGEGNNSTAGPGFNECGIKSSLENKSSLIRSRC